MGNREELLAGARKCLLEKGYVQTTARDIANASGVSLAAIGYHFGTKEALLQEAMVEANVEWGERIATAVESVRMPEGDSWARWFEHVWGRIISVTEEDKRLLMASLEILMNTDHALPVCKSIGTGMTNAGDALVRIFGHDIDELTPGERAALGKFYFALEIGVRLLHGSKPESTPTPQELVVALRAIAPKITDSHLEDALGRSGALERAD